MKIGRGIIFICNKRDISQQELARMTGLSKTMHSLIENGHREPSFDSLNKIAAALKVPIPVITWLSIEEHEIPPENLKEKKEIDSILLKMYQL